MYPDRSCPGRWRSPSTFASRAGIALVARSHGDPGHSGCAVTSTQRVAVATRGYGPPSKQQGLLDRLRGDFHSAPPCHTSRQPEDGNRSLATVKPAATTNPTVTSTIGAPYPPVASRMKPTSAGPTAPATDATIHCEPIT